MSGSTPTLLLSTHLPRASCLLKLSSPSSHSFFFLPPLHRCTLRFPSTNIRIQFENLVGGKNDGHGKSTSVENTNTVYRPLKISIPENEMMRNIKSPFPSPTGTMSAANSCPTSPRHSSYHDSYSQHNNGHSSYEASGSQWAALLAGANKEIKYLFNPNLLGRVRVALIFIISTLIFSRQTGIQRTVDIRHWQWVWETSVQLRSTDCSIDNSSTRQTVDAIGNLFLHFQKLSLLSYRSEQRMAEQVRDDDVYDQSQDC